MEETMTEEYRVPPISEKEKELFSAMCRNAHSILLVSCKVNGENSIALCAAESTETGMTDVEPLYVRVTPGMVLLDSNGKEARELDR